MRCCLAGRPVDDDVALFEAQFTHRHVERDAEVLGDCLQQLAVVAVAVVVIGPSPRPHGTLVEGERVFQDQLRVELLQRPQSRGMWGRRRGGLLKLKVRGSISCRLVPHLMHEKCSLNMRSTGLSRSVTSAMISAPFAQLERGLHRVGQAHHVGAAVLVTPSAPLSLPAWGRRTMMRSIDRFDGVHLVAVQLGHVGHFVDLAVGARARSPAFGVRRRRPCARPCGP